MHAGKQDADVNEKSRAVREMFGSIAGRYDFLNHFLSGNIDRYWRNACVREVEKKLSTQHPRILDIGCGTADLSLALSRLGPVVGCDFSHPMLMLGREKVIRRENSGRVNLLEGDALSLPFHEASFDVVVSAFVLRNLADLVKGLEEMRRVLRGGGVLGILEFGMPKAPILASLYHLYFTRVLPRLGRLLSGVDGPYRYLPDSVQSFPSPEALKGLMIRSGFSNSEYRLLTGGIAVLYLARRAR